jgi:hypothetical protein
MDSTQEQSEQPVQQTLTHEQTYQILLKTPVKDKNTALYMLYCFLKRSVEAHMLSSDEIGKLNLCIEQFPGLDKVSA